MNKLTFKYPFISNITIEKEIQDQIQRLAAAYIKAYPTISPSYSKFLQKQCKALRIHIEQTTPLELTLDTYRKLLNDIIDIGTAIYLNASPKYINKCLKKT